MKNAGLVIEKRDGKWQVRIWGPLPSSKLKKPEKTNQRQINMVLVALVALATAVLGLVTLLISKDTPEWGALLLKLLALVL
jgi:hypothetical protein